jgi:hypothetical protein
METLECLNGILQLGGYFFPSLALDSSLHNKQAEERKSGRYRQEGEQKLGTHAKLHDGLP